MPNLKILFAAAGLTLAGCQTTIQETRTSPLANTFASKLSSEKLAVCIDNNMDGKFMNAFTTTVKSFSAERFEIVVRVREDSYAVVQVSPASVGSTATIRLANRATLSPRGAIMILTKDCE